MRKLLKNSNTMNTRSPGQIDGAFKIVAIRVFLKRSDGTKILGKQIIQLPKLEKENILIATRGLRAS